MQALAALFVLTSAVSQASAPTCATPQDAALALFSDRGAEAAECLDLPAEIDGREVAARLKQLLDARGLYVPVEDLPSDPEFRDADGRHRVQPVPALPEVTLVRAGDRWVWSRSTVTAVPTLYAETFSPVLLAVQDVLPPAFQRELLGFHLWQYVYFLLLVGLSVLAGTAAPLVVQRFVVRAAGRVGVPFHSGTVAALRGPAMGLASGLVLTWGIADLQLGVGPSRMLRTAAGAIVSISAVLVAVRLVDVGAALFSRRASRTESTLDDQVVPLASRAAKAAVIALGVVFVLQNWGIDVGSLLAGLGIGGLAVALAAKDTLANLFGSVTLFTDRPFHVGDWVVIDGAVEGTVAEVGFRSTRIRTFPDSVVSLPNGKVADARIENLGQRRRRRVRVVLNLTYDTPLDRLDAYIEAVRQMLAAEAAVWPGQIEVHLNELGPHSLDVLVYFFLEVRSWKEELAARAACLRSFLRLAEERGVRFAFPSTSVYVEQVPALPSDGEAAPR